jgi:hypothetical protein
VPSAAPPLLTAISRPNAVPADNKAGNQQFAYHFARMEALVDFDEKMREL